MSDSKRPGGAGADWVDPERTRPKNAFDTDDETSGQQYTLDREEAQAREDAGHDTPHPRTTPDPPPPEDPDDFKVPGSSAPR